MGALLMSSFPGLAGRPASGAGDEWENSALFRSWFWWLRWRWEPPPGAVPDLAPSNAGILPNDGSAQLVVSAHALELSGQRDEALVDYTEAIESRHLNREAQSRALFDRGLLLDSMNRLSDALQDYSAAVSLSPKFAAALNNRANVYRRMSRFKDAKRDYQASLAAGNLQGQYPYYGLGQIAEAEGKPDQAKALYRKALAMEPDFVLASQKLAALEDARPHSSSPAGGRQISGGGASDRPAAAQNNPQGRPRTSCGPSPPACCRARLL